MHGTAPCRGRVLLACTPQSEPILRDALQPLDIEVVSAFAHDAAMALVEAGVDLAVCSLSFDESRMLDFIAELARERPRLPLVCCRVLAELPEHSLRAAFTAADYLGAAAVVDFPDAARGAGATEAGVVLRRAVSAHLAQGVGQPSMS